MLTSLFVVNIGEQGTLVSRLCNLPLLTKLDRFNVMSVITSPTTPSSPLFAPSPYLPRDRSTVSSSLMTSTVPQHLTLSGIGPTLKSHDRTGLGMGMTHRIRVSGISRPTPHGPPVLKFQSSDFTTEPSPPATTPAHTTLSRSNEHHPSSVVGLG